MTQKNARHELRIIGGAWRGRRLQFAAVEAIRPTPDRVRETLFNWLQFNIAGTRCLDLFAGSGALGLEALSRGAGQVVFVERERAAVEKLREILQVLKAGNGQVQLGDAHRFLAGSAVPFDVVFLDPPFKDAAKLREICATLERGGWLAPSAYIYIESPASAGAPELPPGWILHRTGCAGEVGYHLARREPPADASSSRGPQ